MAIKGTLGLAKASGSGNRYVPERFDFIADIFGSD